MNTDLRMTRDELFPYATEVAALAWSTAILVALAGLLFIPGAACI